MFEAKGTREDIKSINKLVEEKGLGQLETNLYILMRDIVFFNSQMRSIKNMSMSPYITNQYTNVYANEEYLKYLSKYSETLSKELITPEISESSIVSKEDFDFLRDVYSLDGTPLKTFSFLKKKYGKEFEQKHCETILNLKDIFSISNDLIILKKYVDENGIYIDDIITDDLEDSNRFSIKESIDYLKNGISNVEFQNKKDEIIKKSLYKELLDNKNYLLIFFLEKEFKTKNEDGVYDFPNDYSEEIDYRLKEFCEGNTSNFIEYINKKYDIDFNPTEEMIEKIDEFKKYYKDTMSLKQKNDLIYSKNINTNIFRSFSSDVDDDSEDYEDDSYKPSFAEYIINYNNLVDSNFEKKKKGF